MAVITVLGEISTSDLGVTLPHEHLLCDLRNQYTEAADPEQQRIGRQEITHANVHLVADNPYALRDNLLLDDVDLAVQEVGLFQRAGGTTIVDCTCRGIGPQPRQLKRVSERTGVNIVAGCGYYTQDTHPEEMSAWSAERIADEMLGDLTEGIGNTGIRAGVIGEIGTSHPIHRNEQKNLVAAALAFRQSLAAIYVHTYPWGRDGLAAARILMDAGADPAKIVICHTDVEPDLEYMRSLLELGVYIEFDDFGKEFGVLPAAGFAAAGD